MRDEVCKSYRDLVMALRQRQRELGFSYLALDEVAGLHSGYSSKVLGPNPGTQKSLGPLSLDLILTALGVKLVVAEAKPAKELRIIRDPKAPNSAGAKARRLLVRRAAGISLCGHETIQASSSPQRQSV